MTIRLWRKALRLSAMMELELTLACGKWRWQPVPLIHVVHDFLPEIMEKVKAWVHRVDGGFQFDFSKYEHFIIISNLIKTDSLLEIIEFGILIWQMAAATKIIWSNLPLNFSMLSGLNKSSNWTGIRSGYHSGITYAPLTWDLSGKNGKLCICQ